MELRQYLREVWAYRFGIVAAVAVSAIFVFLITNSTQKTYTAEARLVVVAGLGSDGSDTDDMLNAPRVGATYAVLATTRPVLLEVIEAAELPYSALELSSKIVTTASLDTPFMTITMDDADPELAAAAANALADVLVARATIDPPGEAPPVQLLSVVEEADVPDDPSAPRVLFSTMLSAAAALAACLVILALVVYIRADPAVTRGSSAG